MPSSPAGRGGVLAIVVASVVFSWSYPLVKWLGMPAATISFHRLWIGGLTLTIAALVLRVPWPKAPRTVVAAGLFFGIHQLLFIAATQRTSIAVVTLLGALKPLLVALVSRRFVGERVSRTLAGWSVVALVGVGVVMQANLATEGRTLFGDVLAVLNLFAYTAFFLLAKRAREEGAPTLTLTASTLLVALAIVTPALAFGSSPWPPSGLHFALLLFLALVPGNGHLLVNWAHVRVTAALSALTLAIVPILSSYWAFLAFGEPYGPRHLAGMALVALAIEGGRRAELAGADVRVTTR